MKVRFCIFTFGRDAEPAFVLCEYLKKSGMGEAVVIDDGASPFSVEDKKRIESVGAKYEVSSWPRRGNLNGKRAILGILSDLFKHSNGVEWVVKVDADTLPQPELLEELSRAKQDIVCCGHGTPEYPLLGACYALRPSVLQPLQYAVATRVTEDQSAPEDKTLGPIILAQGHDIRACLLGYQDYHFPGLYLRNLPSYAVCFGFITDVVGKPGRTKHKYAAFVADKMRGFLRLSMTSSPSGVLRHSKTPKDSPDAK